MKSKALAICLSCGTEKVLPMGQCRRCNFLPLSLDDRAKSVILSSRMFEIPLNIELEGVKGVPVSLTEITEIAKDLEEGRSYHFNQMLVDEVKKLIVASEEFGKRLSWTKLFFHLSAIAFVIGAVCYFLLGIFSA